MADRCPSLEELLRLEALPAGDSARAHLDECPRCEALVAGFGNFRRASLGPPGARPAEAEEALERLLERELGDEVSPGRWRIQPWIPLAAAAVLLLGIFGVPRILDRSGGDSPEIRLRSAPDRSTELLEGLESRAAENGGRQLSWDPVDGAVTYEVRLYDAGLEEVGVIDAGTATTWHLPAADPDDLAGRVPAWWAVAVRRGPDDVAISRLVPLRTR